MFRWICFCEKSRDSREGWGRRYAILLTVVFSFYAVSCPPGAVETRARAAKFIASHRVVGTVTPISAGSPADLVRSIFVAANGTVWVGTDSGIYSCDPAGTGIRFYSDGLAGDPITLIAESADGNLWCSDFRFGHGLSRFDGASWRLVQESEFPEAGSSIVSITWMGGGSGTFWLVTPHNLYTYHSGAWSKVRDFPDDVMILSGLEDRDGNLWLGLQKGGLLRYTPKTSEWQPISPVAKNAGLEARQSGTEFQKIQAVGVNTIYQDRLGRIWIATLDAHLFVWDESLGNWNEIDLPERFSLEGWKYGDRNLGIDAIYQDKQGNMMFATDGGFVVWREKEDKWERYAEESTLKTWWVTAIAEDHSGRIWLGVTPPIILEP